MQAIVCSTLTLDSDIIFLINIGFWLSGGYWWKRQHSDFDTGRDCTLIPILRWNMLLPCSGWRKCVQVDASYKYYQISTSVTLEIRAATLSETSVPNNNHISYQSSQHSHLTEVILNTFVFWINIYTSKTNTNAIHIEEETFQIAGFRQFELTAGRLVWGCHFEMCDSYTF
jgi:hypothetical protein